MAVSLSRYDVRCVAKCNLVVLASLFGAFVKQSVGVTFAFRRSLVYFTFKRSEFRRWVMSRS